MSVISRQEAAGRQVLTFSPLEAHQPLLPKGISEVISPVHSKSLKDSEIATMAERIASLEAALEAERAKRQEACEAAFADGRKKGKADVENDAANRLGILREATAQAAADCTALIDQRGDIAVAIALAALAKILGEKSQYGPMVEAVIREHFTRVAANSVLRVRVSESDFADENQIAALMAEYAGIRIERDAKLPTGSCLFDLTLGAIDASITTQADAVDALLSPLASNLKNDR